MEKKSVKKPQVTLKRQVVVKAIVTNQFKEYLNFELTETISIYRTQIDQIDAQLAQLDQNDPAYAKLVSEKRPLESYITSESEQRTFVDGLEMGSLYSQGPIEGMVPITVGDNLYEKLGGIEMIVKDGLVQKISLSKDFQPGKPVSPIAN